MIHFPQKGKPDRDFHFLFCREKEGKGGDAPVPEHRKKAPQGTLEGIRQAFKETGTAAGEAKAHLLR